MKAETIVVVAGGHPSALPSPVPARRARSVIAADSGVDLALALGLHVDVAIGDFDSVTAGRARGGRGGRRAASSATRPPRTRPTSSSRSTPRSRSSRHASS